jgi:hypothetical protein
MLNVSDFYVAHHENFFLKKVSLIYSTLLWITGKFKNLMMH